MRFLFYGLFFNGFGVDGFLCVVFVFFGLVVVVVVNDFFCFVWLLCNFVVIYV